MIEDEDADALLRIGDPFQALLELFENRGEGVFLDQVEQALFGLEVVIEAGERHAAGARKVAHGGAFIAFVAEDRGGVIEDLAHAAVEAGRGPGGAGLAGASGGRVAAAAVIRSNVRSNYRALAGGSQEGECPPHTVSS